MFLCVKTYQFCAIIADMGNMNLAKAIRNKINTIEAGTIFGLKDFADFENSQVVILELSRLTKKGVINRLSKGKYYIPKKTKFGELAPQEWQILDKIIKENGGYFAGTFALNRIGVTTQIPSEILIRGARSNRFLKIGNLRIKFSNQGLKNVSYQESKLTDIIETLRLVNNIPNGNLEFTLKKISSIVMNLDELDLKKLIELTKQERPSVRALIGAILEKNNSYYQSIKATLNPVSKYKLNISKALLPNKEKWGIV